MAHRRTRRRAAGARRSTNWNAPFVQDAQTSVAAGVQTNGTLIIGPPDGVTVVRILGNVSLQSTADVANWFHLGFQFTSENGTLQPVHTVIGVETDVWMYWTSRLIPLRLEGGLGPMLNFPVDIRVGRKLKEDETVSVSVRAINAYVYSFNLRILEMAT